MLDDVLGGAMVHDVVDLIHGVHLFDVLLDVNKLVDELGNDIGVHVDEVEVVHKLVEEEQEELEELDEQEELEELDEQEELDEESQLYFLTFFLILHLLIHKCLSGFDQSNFLITCLVFLIFLTIK
jgi:hypothetical protein